MPTIYVLKLEAGKWYIGKTSRTLTDRIVEHFENCGSEWTRKYKPVSFQKITENGDAFDEDKYTKIYMSKYGVDNVRGGSYSSIKLTSDQIQCLGKEMQSAEDRCFGCGKKGHFITHCPNKPNCVRCGRNNHTAKQCYAKTDVNGNQIQIEDSSRCDRCGRESHTTNKCYAKTDIYGHDLENGEWMTCIKCGRNGHLGLLYCPYAEESSCCIQ